MAALNIPLILWFVIVVAMTAVISIKLFRNDTKEVMDDHSHEINGEREDLIILKRKIS